ncbi:putative transcriptional regulator LYSR-type [Shigella flexneri 1485-80]|nr:putative transcriptional regulator LYSR-type [Shigella flexneri 1485-80]
MDDCGAVLHNIETKWLYDFLTLEKCRNFSQAAVSRNVSQPAFSRRIRALEQAIGVELFNRQVTPLQLSEQGKIFHSQIRHLLQQLESNLAELRGGSDYAQRKIKIAAAHSLSLGLLPSIISQMPPLFTWAIEAIDVDEAVDKLREGQSDCIFPFTTKICWKHRLTTFAYLNLNCSPFAPVTNTEKQFLTSRSHTFRY